MRGVSSVLLEILRARIWVVPGLAALLATVAALVVLLIESTLGSDAAWSRLDADSARSVLSAISGAMISFTALVFSITMLVLQQASAQLSPRVMRTFLRDRYNQAVLGLFVASFVFALLILLGIDGDSASWLGVSVAVVLVLAALLAFVAYIDHMGHAIRPTSVIRAVGEETHAAIERNYPVDEATAREGVPTSEDPSAVGRAPRDEDAQLVDWTGESGYLQAFDEAALLRLAERLPRPLVLTAGVGAYLVRGSPFLSFPRGQIPGLEDADVAALARTGIERTMSQDPEFGFRQLVDIALRALSPSLNDPTTAVQVIDQLHDLLRSLVERPIPAPRVLRSEAGAVVVVPAPDWDTYIHVAVDQIAHAGREHAVIGRRLRLMLEDLARGGSAGRQVAIRRALDVLDTTSPTT